MRRLFLPTAAALALALPGDAEAKTPTMSWWGYNGDRLDQFIVKPVQENAAASWCSKPATTPTA